MKIKVKTFANVKDLCGFDEKEFSISETARVRDVINELIKINPLLSEIKDSLLFAINEEYCARETLLKNDDILAIFPPVSGG